MVLWDDHEVLNNWYPGEVLDDPRYTERSVDLLAARARRAFLEHYPLRRSPADPERIYRSLPFGESLEVFVLDMRSERARELREPAGRSRPGDRAPRPRAARVAEGAARRLARHLEGGRERHADRPRGRRRPGRLRGGGERRRRAARSAASTRSPSLLSFLKARDVRNVVWITADVHYAAVHHYGPERARFRGLPALLRDRGRTGPRGHVRPGRARPDVRPRGALPRHPARG